ncbi:MAG TPA: hypothetical protein VHL34_00650 [Rhizomicrobium sp.]|jgi:modulator of FtsH protease|nr:hypothetical protein [Rhizomicrobium sp.]
MGTWSDFFAAQVGAAAALAGLVIVGISINVNRILSHPLLPGRAAETLITPTGVLVIATFLLVPGQAAWILGLELIASGAVMALIAISIQIRASRAPGREASLWPRVLLSQGASLPFVAAGGLMLFGSETALYWVVPGIVVSLIATVVNAWVLLVEILR